MALSQSVEDSLKEATQNLRNALAFAARTERPMVCSVIADLISRIESVQNTDAILDKLENRNFGDTGFFGPVFGE
jgi:ATP/maltotriose-dependent transcriptional regulator MalT